MTTRPQPHEQLLVGWIVRGMTTMTTTTSSYQEQGKGQRRRTNNDGKGV
jgi:hypothetical protein